MKTFIQSLVLCAAAANLSGCLLFQRVTWSPDGSTAAVIAGNGGLRFADPQGKLTPLLLDHTYAAQWLANGKELLVSRIANASSWNELTQVLTEPLKTNLLNLADRLRPMLEKDPDWDAIDKLIPDEMPRAATRVVLYLALRDLRHDPAADKIAQKYGYSADASVTVHYLQRAAVQEGRVLPGQVIASSLKAFVSTRICAPQQLAAFTLTIPAQGENGEPATRDLYIVPLDASTPPIRIASADCLYPDWSLDGRDLFYTGKTKEGGDMINSVMRQRFTNARPDGEPQELAYMVHTDGRVRCLPDGRVIFASLPITLPATEADVPQRQELFALDPQRQSTLSRLTPLSAAHDLPQDLSYFEPSPDYKKIAFLGDKGRVAVMDLTTGQTWAVSTTDTKEVRTLPAWRNNDELTLAVSHIGDKDTDADRDEIALWSESTGLKPLSRDWPDEVVSGFLK